MLAHNEELEKCKLKGLENQDFNRIIEQQKKDHNQELEKLESRYQQSLQEKEQAVQNLK